MPGPALAPLRRAAGEWLSALFLIVSLTTACSDDPVAPEDPGDGLESATPEAVGWSSEKLVAASAFAAQSGYAAVMAVHDGKVFFSWGDVSRNFRCHSIRKPFLSALYGIHIARGELRLDATGAWVDPGDAGLQLVLMIINARSGSGS